MSDNNNQPEITQAELRKILVKSFSLSELKVLCFDLEVEYETFPHNTLDEIAIGMISFLKRNNRLQELLNDERIKPKIQAILFIKQEVNSKGLDSETSNELKPIPVKLLTRNYGKLTKIDLLYTLTGHTDSINSITFSPNSKLLASASVDKTVRIWQFVTIKSSLILKGHMHSVNNVTFSPDGSLLASGGEDKTVRLWRASDGEFIQSFEHSGLLECIYSLAFSPNGTMVAAGGFGISYLWRLEDGKMLLSLGPLRTAMYNVAFMFDGFLMSVGLGESIIDIWDMEAKNLLLEFKFHESFAEKIAISPNGSILAVDKVDHTVHLWKIPDGTKLETLEGHSKYVLSLAFSPDGNFLATASSDKTIRIWDVEDGKCLFTLRGHSDSVTSVAFSPDGNLLASGSSDNTIKLWQLHYSE